ncbi:hypothetical protein SDC9_124328 [bioreactor metagenome]|uniref:Uncharacterized protein n=1 Tax=bioreactor metagenome TaxID=1076179 RepID=A0A645CK63_9ZZZZ|nr:hypothetical protein [Candidatus Metalachnospira sp.]
MEPYDYWFSFSRDSDVSFDGEEFSISSSVEVYCATNYNSSGVAKYKSTTFTRSMSIDVDDIIKCTETVVSAACLAALIVYLIPSGGATAPAVVYMLDKLSPVFA